MPTLNWIGKDKVVNHHQDVPYKVLEHQYGFRADDETDKTETLSGNKIIHGDNLEALKALLPEYEGSVNCIYIDPPYNTGNEKWVYNDNVNDPKIRKWLGEVVGAKGEDLSRHDKWLCMMYPRLKLLHRLLANDGAIFISIDDNEQANLKLLCDEIFGSNNFITSIPWQSRQSLQNDTDLSINHEYILVYAKKRRQKDRRLKESNAKTWHEVKEFAFYPIKVDNEKYSNPDNDSRGAWKADPFDAPNIRPNLTYPIINPNTGKQYLPPRGRCWRISPEKFNSALADNRIIFGKNGKGKPQLKIFLNEKIEFGSVPNSWFTGDENGTATKGTKELQQIFPDFDTKAFDTPKPTKLIEHILELSTLKDGLILDSFAGSGTTAHAVLNMNKDGSNRKFILVEMENYAETLTAERVRRVMRGYGVGKNAVAGTGGVFDYYELGKPIFKQDKNLNEEVGENKIREYIYYTETKHPLERTRKDESRYLLDTYNDTGYYFFYEKDSLTTLSVDTLNIVTEKAEQYIIYADKCMIDKADLEAKHIIFKKIPRDIKRF